MNSGSGPIAGSGGVTVLISLDRAIGNVTMLPLKVNSGFGPMAGSGGVTVLISLDNVIGKSTILPFKIIGGDEDLPVNELPETCANSGISICKRRWHLNS